jgi:hypothetical protein
MLTAISKSLRSRKLITPRSFDARPEAAYAGPRMRWP